MSAGQTANGTGPTFDINDPSGWELALVTNPTDTATAAANHSKLVSVGVFFETANSLVESTIIYIF